MNFHKAINRMLAAYVSVINAVVAVAIPLVMGLIVGNLLGNAPLSDFSMIGFIGGFIVGALGGVLVAGAVCGVLAVLIDIRNSLADR